MYSSVLSQARPRRKGASLSMAATRRTRPRRGRQARRDARDASPAHRARPPPGTRAPLQWSLARPPPGTASAGRVARLALPPREKRPIPWSGSRRQARAGRSAQPPRSSSRPGGDRRAYVSCLAEQGTMADQRRQTPSRKEVVGDGFRRAPARWPRRCRSSAA